MGEVLSSSGEAVRLAIKLAVDAGEYDRAAAVLDVLRRALAPATVTPIGAARERERA
jgi:hypothetical protein